MSDLFKLPEQETIVLKLLHSQAAALAQFVTCVGWSEISGCSVDDKEIYEIEAALKKLAIALADAGYEPQ